MYDEVVVRLAAQMGVAVEVLWGALLVQAKIYSIFATALVIVGGVALAEFWRWLRHYVGSITEPGDVEVAVCAWAAWGVLFVILVFTVITYAADILAGFFNPEYWALMEVLSKCG